MRIEWPSAGARQNEQPTPDSASDAQPSGPIGGSTIVRVIRRYDFDLHIAPLSHDDTDLALREPDDDELDRHGRDRNDGMVGLDA